MTQAGGGRRHAGEHALQGVDGAEDRIEERKEDHDHEARPDQADQRHRRAGQAADAAAEHHREIDDRRPRQDLAQRIGVVELRRRHPFALLDQHAPRPVQHAAEAGERDDREGDEEFEDGGRGRAGVGVASDVVSDMIRQT